jgi:hypothetical protein
MWRYEPLGPERFPIGAGPFHARGLAYTHMLGYVDARIDGARRTLLEHLGPADPFRAYYDQIFLVTGEYDVSPLVRLFLAAAKLKGKDVGTFIQRRAARSGGTDTKGLWKPMLHGRTPAEVASRLHMAFARYFPPCTADSLEAKPGMFRGELRGLPACMDGVYADSTVGFYLGALGSAGATNVVVDFERPVSDGTNTDVPLERIRFTVRWDETTP